MDFKALVELTRPLNCVIAAVATYIGYTISVSALQWDPLMPLAMAAVFLVCAGGQTINDYFDCRIDKKINPKKPLPSGRVPLRTAFSFALVLFIAGIILAYFVNFAAFALAVIFSFLLFAYSAFCQKIKYLGNFIVAFGTGFTLIYGATLSGNYFLPAILAVSAITANLGRELLKDLEQVKIEKGVKITLPQKVSLKASQYLVFFYFLITIITVYIPGILALFMQEAAGFGSLPYIIIVSLAAFALVYAFKLSIDKNFKQAQQFSKYGMVLALIAFFVGAIF